MILRDLFPQIMARFLEKRRFIQVLLGPRQVGKSTLAHQLVQKLALPSHEASADTASLKDNAWIVQQWELARLKARQSPHGALLVLDEVQKIPNFSESIKALWDEDSRLKLNLKVLLLGSSALLIQKGLSESLAGRFELNHLAHWSYGEVQKAFGLSLDQYLYFGAYPASLELIQDPERWAHYIRESLVETTLSRDVLLMHPVQKPALLRQLFSLSTHYSSQILSYNKMLGQLQDAGNTTTLAHYLKLLAQAGLVTGLEKISPRKLSQRASSPKLQVYNMALCQAFELKNFSQVRQDPSRWGRLVESAVGAHLINECYGKTSQVFYWREGNFEVNYIIKHQDQLLAIEVKNHHKKTNLPGLQRFCQTYPKTKSLVVGGSGLDLENFFKLKVEELF